MRSHSARRMSPLVADSSPRSSRSSVVLPLPFGPTRPTRIPAVTMKLSLSKRVRSSLSGAGMRYATSSSSIKRLIELEDVAYRIPAPDNEDRTLFDKLNFIVTAGMRVGLVGPNGSGKTTLLRLLRGELSATSGDIRRAEWLRIVYFDQTRELDSNVTLRRALAPEGDSVIYQDRVIHVASWAARFLFTGEQLNQPVERLSGGERARVLIAQLMLQPADVLLLDEPTNDLDIPTLEILEESLLEFRGSLVLVTHDRFLLDRVSNIVFGLDGFGGAERFADYFQWEEWKGQNQRARASGLAPGGTNGSAPSREENPSAANSSQAASKKKLTYKEAREFELMEK